MCRVRCYRWMLLFALLMGSALPGWAQTAQEKADAEVFLKKWQQTNLIEDKEFDVYRKMGPKALALFAGFLEHKELGLHAELAMQQVDSIGATPYLLKLLPKKDGNAQRFALRAANRSLLEYGWHERAGKPEPKPGEPAPRYPRNTKPYPYVKEIYEAAVAILADDKEDGAEATAIETVGLTGSKRDVPLLKKMAKKEGYTYGRFCTSALARLGDKEALDEIARELEKPVPSKPAEAVTTDSGVKREPKPGAIVVVPTDARRLQIVMAQAAFSMNRRFVPLLIRHLNDPPAQHYGDYSDPSPVYEAQSALSQIVFGKEYAVPNVDWKQWWREHEKEYKR